MPGPKLIFVNRFFHPDESATSQILSDLCFDLAALGWDVRVVASNQDNSGSGARLHRSEEVRRVQVSRVWSTNWGKRSMLGRIADYLSFYPSAFLELIRLCDPGDVVVVKTDPPLVSVVALAAAKIRRGRLVNWLQDLYPEVAIQLGVRALRGPLGALLIASRNIALRSADANVVIGAGMAERLGAAGVRKDAVHLLPNWSDDEVIRPIATQDSRVRRGWGIAEDVFVFGYSGNLGRAHESETILGAAKLLSGRPDICFLFVGGGHESRKLQATLAASGLSNALFKPHQPREDLSDSLAAADAHWLSLRPGLEGLIVPSKFYGIASAGRPVIAVTAKDGEIARAVRELDCGYVVEPGDAAGLAAAIVELADDPERRSAMGARARRGTDEKYARRLALNRWDWILTKVAARQADRVERHPSAVVAPEPMQPLIDELEHMSGGGAGN